MKQNEVDIKQEIKAFIEHVKRIDDAYTKIRDLLGCTPDSKFFSDISAMQDGYMRLLSKIAGDKYDTISWYIYENDYGKRGFKCIINGEERAIKTIDDLMWLIGIK